MNKRDTRICEIWDELEEEFDKSTNWMMAMCIDRYRERHHAEVDEGDIAGALYQQSLDQDGQP